MWLGDHIGRGDRGGWAKAQVGEVTIGGQSAAVMLSGEMRDGSVLSAGGIEWLPERGTDVLLLQTDDGERYVLGVRCEGKGLAPGELRLRSGDAKITLEKNGKISVEGSLEISGDVFITGRLFVNGMELGGRQDGNQAG